MGVLLDIPELENPIDTLCALKDVPPYDDPERDCVARIFAVNTAERMLNRLQKCGVDCDPRLWRIIETARRHAFGKATNEGLTAAWLEAWDLMGQSKGNVALAVRDVAWEDAVTAACIISNAARAASANHGDENTETAEQIRVLRVLLGEGN